MDKSRGNQQNRERRVFTRYQCDFLVSIRNERKNQEFDANAHNISAQGVGLVCPLNLEKGEELEIWIHLPQASPFHNYGKVIWCKKEKNELWYAGVKFDETKLFDLGVAFEKAGLVL